MCAAATKAAVMMSDEVELSFFAFLYAEQDVSSLVFELISSDCHSCNTRNMAWTGTPQHP